jgi:hypothetical protein
VKIFVNVRLCLQLYERREYRWYKVKGGALQEGGKYHDLERTVKANRGARGHQCESL